VRMDPRFRDRQVRFQTHIIVFAVSVPIRMSDGHILGSLSLLSQTPPARLLRRRNCNRSKGWRGL